MGKGKHNEWQQVRVNKLYEDDYEPNNKVIRKRIKNKINKEIKIILQEENKNKKNFLYTPPLNEIF